MKQSRITRQKRVILDVLKVSTSHLTAEEVYRLAKKKMKAIGVATVYRNLEAMSEDGVIDTIYIAGSPKWYEMKKSGYHGHLFCEECGKLEDIVSCFLCLTKNQIKNMGGFEAYEFRILVIGKCKSCLERNIIENK